MPCERKWSDGLVMVDLADEIDIFWTLCNLSKCNLILKGGDIFLQRSFNQWYCCNPTPRTSHKSLVIGEQAMSIRL